MSDILIGRHYEKQQLQKAFDSKEAELIVVYGRRRVGKTFLIRRFFEEKEDLFFQISGIHKGSLKIQLQEFKNEVERVFYRGTSIHLENLKSWMNALAVLTDSIERFNKNKKTVLFFDEFPWLASPKSGLQEAFEYYWNRFWVNNPNIKVVICGSAASWMIKNILNNKGGLHNRVTRKLRLEPFTLYETREYLTNRGVSFNNHQILDLYMCIGGIPFYLKFIEKGLSIIQNINQLCFQKGGMLLDEFQNLFSSLFDHADIHEKIIRFIATKREGISRLEIEAFLDSKGGRLTERLKELEEAGFIMSFLPWGRGRGIYYKVIDEYTLFYLNWIVPENKRRITKEMTSAYWESIAQTPGWKAWVGYAFEAICYKNLDNIKKTLRIPEGSSATSWRYRSKKKGEEGAQIDLLFDRLDDTINLCEIKYSKNPYSIDKIYAKDLLRKKDIYQQITKTRKQIIISMITSCSLKKTIYSEEIISSEMGLDDFFKAL